MAVQCLNSHSVYNRFLDGMPKNKFWGSILRAQKNASHIVYEDCNKL